MTSLPPIKWPTGRTPTKVEIFAHQHKGGRVALHVVELDTKLIYPAFLLEDMTGHWNSAEGWRSNPFLWVKGNEGDTRILHFKGNPSTWEGVWQTQNKVRDVKALPAFANTHNDGIDRKSDELINTFTYEQACQDRGPLEDTKTADTLPIPKAFYTTWGKMRADYLAEYDKYVGMTPAPGGNVTVAHKEFWTKLCRKQKGGEAILPYTQPLLCLTSASSCSATRHSQTRMIWKALSPSRKAPPRRSEQRTLRRNGESRTPAQAISLTSTRSASKPASLARPQPSTSLPST